MLASPSLVPLTMVAKLLDGYLAEVAPDINLKLSKFRSLATAIPDCARPIDDGLYRAIDIYLKCCQYLAMISLGSRHTMVPDNASYVHVAKFMKKGFAFSFPLEVTPWTYSWIIDTCLKDSMSYFHEQMSRSNIQNRTSAVVGIDMHFLRCVNDYSYQTKLFWAALVIVSVIYIVKFITVLVIVSRFMFAPLAVLTFLAYKYWKTKISIDAVEKFLQMQLALGATRYAYTDIIAITSHFREKLGQGGYGSVYKGVLPGDVHVLSKCWAIHYATEKNSLVRCPPSEVFTMLM